MRVDAGLYARILVPAKSEGAWMGLLEYSDWPGNATVGTLFSDAVVEFLLTAGSAAFINGDTIVIVTTARTYADVSGGGFTALDADPTSEKLALNFDQAPRYLRVNYDIGGTVSPAYTVAVAAQSATN